MSRLIHLFIVAVASTVLVGCQTDPPRAPSQEGDIIYYTGDTPVWIFIPFPLLTGGGRGYVARVALPPHRGWTTNRVEILVAGEVAAAGAVKLRPGSTVLQAIGAAGGFGSGALARRGVMVERNSGYVRLYLHSRWAPGARYREVWYDTKPEGPYPSPKDAGGPAAGDYVLEPGDKIFVARAVD
jgi:hypothetical protein